MRHSRTLGVCLLFATMIAGGCVSGTQQTITGGARKNKGPNEPVSIGFSMDTLKEERWQRDKDLVEKHAKELGMQVFVQVANGDENLQVKQAENLLRDCRFHCRGCTPPGCPCNQLRSTD